MSSPFPSSMPSTSEEMPSESSSGCRNLPDPLPFCTESKHQMLLHFAEREFVLFSFWKTGSATGMFGSCLLVILLCIASEAIELCRNFLAKEHALMLSDNLSEDNSSISESIQESGRNGVLSKLRRCFNSYRVTQASLYGIHVLFGHVLILIIVSFNVWLLISVAIGKGIGYFLFKCDPIVEKTSIALEAASPQPSRCHLAVPYTPTFSSSTNIYGKSLNSNRNSNES